MTANQTHAAPLDGAHLTAAQADFILRALQDFRPFTDKDARNADALRAQLRPALAAFDAAQKAGVSCTG